ncbi:MDR family MFS transporter [Bordetella genomosp. 9]|uniref:MFS transporter n=1 Tax=Bordetella genomosp. 9 TaxID=1416803 RepID=A0A1W6Z2A6_9BORD|nr:MDR family MFS transporter [Bordetella genomosp. 9]ARP87522.1 MFS transporter [Bordetella genomosp. 9]
MRVIGGIVLCILLAALDQTVVIPAVPAIAADLNGFGHLSWIVAAYLIAATVTTPIYGKLSDIYGRRQLLTVSIGLFVVTSALCAMAQTLNQLILFRTLQGLAGGGLMSLAQAAIADVVAPRQRGRYQGYLAAVWGVASIAGPLVGGYVSEHLSWRWLFWMNLPLGLFAMYSCNRGLRMLKPRGGKVRLDILGSMLLASAIVPCLLALGWGGASYGWLSPEIFGLIALSVAALAALVWQERRAADPLLPPRMFRNRTFVCGIAASSLGALGIFLCIFSLPLYFQLVRGTSASESGLFVTPFLLSNVLGNMLSSNLARRTGRMRGILSAGFIGGFLGLCLLALMGPGTPLIFVLAATLLAGVGLGSCMVATIMVVQNALDPRDIGAGTGSVLVLRSIGSAFGSALAGTLLGLGFAGSLAAAGITQQIDLGALRHGSDVLSQLPVPARQALMDGVAHTFHTIFAFGAVIALVSLLVVRRMPDLELRNVAASDLPIGD